MKLIIKYKWLIAGVLLGAVGGFLYWNYIGCLSGHCSITSVWYNSSIYGSLMGGLLGSTIQDVRKK